jgi:hypothetical protein
MASAQDVGHHMPTDKYGNWTVAGSGIGASIAPIRPKVFADPNDLAYFGFLGANAPMEKFAEKMRRPAPPKTPTTYLRTGLLTDKSWFVDRRGAFIDVYNTASYATFVYGDNHGERQQLQHQQTGWLNMYTEFQKVKPQVIASAQESMNARIKALGLGPGD